MKREPYEPGYCHAHKCRISRRGCKLRQKKSRSQNHFGNGTTGITDYTCNKCDGSDWEPITQKEVA